ncbi:MAG: comEA [Gammaproteobacteria bacterium]|jgi:competence protein ComEA|nr:comEA [Gammaproteobacteria bacterium]
MSFYRTLIATVAALGLATSVFAADEAATESPAATTQTTATTTTTSTTAAPIDLNTATVEDLSKISGLTKAKATKIVKYRDANGNFSSVDDLKKVKGLGLSAKQMKKVKAQLTVG